MEAERWQVAQRLWQRSVRGAMKPSTKTGFLSGTEEEKHKEEGEAGARGRPTAEAMVAMGRCFVGAVYGARVCAIL